MAPSVSSRAGRRASAKRTRAANARHSGSLGQQLGQHRRQVQHLTGVAGMLPGPGGILVGAGIGHFQGREHRRQPFRPGLGAGDLERHAGLGDLLLGAGQALEHGRLGDQERAGDLLHRQAAD
jgi:hypothetical protein